MLPNTLETSLSRFILKASSSVVVQALFSRWLPYTFDVLMSFIFFLINDLDKNKLQLIQMLKGPKFIHLAYFKSFYWDNLPFKEI